MMILSSSEYLEAINSLHTCLSHCCSGCCWICDQIQFQWNPLFWKNSLAYEFMTLFSFLCVAFLFVNSVVGRMIWLAFFGLRCVLFAFGRYSTGRLALICFTNVSAQWTCNRERKKISSLFDEDWRVTLEVLAIESVSATWHMIILLFTMSARSCRDQTSDSSVFSSCLSIWTRASWQWRHQTHYFRDYNFDYLHYNKQIC